jgi:hypothetical protein
VADGMFDRMQQNAQRRVDDFVSQTRRYNRGEIGLGDQMLQGAANTVGLFTDVPAEMFMTAASAVTPDIVKRGIKDIGNQLMDTEAAKAATQYLQQNPDMAKRLGYGLDLGAVVPAAGAARTGTRALSLEAPNRQPYFYGSGMGGQLASVGVTAPRAVADTLSPSAVASRRQGLPMSVRRSAAPITENRITRYNELNAKADKTEADNKFLREFKEDLSYLEGQLDQTQLIQYGRGTETQGIVKEFENLQAVALGSLDVPTIKNAVANSPALRKNNITLDDNIINTVVDRIKQAQGVDDALVVVRNPTAFSDIAKETLKGKSTEASFLFHGMQQIRKLFPNKTEFSQDELVEFAALSKMMDKTTVNKESGKPLNAAERFINKMTESSKYTTKNTRQQTYTKIEQYFKYKKMEDSGQKMTKGQQAAYEQAQAMLDKAKSKIKVEDGVVYVRGSHLSAAKGLGGVLDEIVMNTKGDTVHFIADKNDLFGMTPPGDKQVISIAVPNGYNVFNKPSKTVPAPDKEQKRQFQENLAARGAEPAGATRVGLLTQTARAINQERPRVRPTDVAPAAGVATGTAVAGTAGDRTNEE